VVHWEITARNPDAQAGFYRSLFGWEIGEGPIQAVAPGLGGPEPGPAGHIREGASPGVSLYVQVRDLQHSLVMAESLGASVTVQPIDVPGGGPTLAAIEDPEGNTFFLVQQ
jgi:predicted enzyme related to lactoylglutathione lyase